MNLDLDVQLQVALRALEDTVAPALGEAPGVPVRPTARLE